MVSLKTESCDPFISVRLLSVPKYHVMEHKSFPANLIEQDAFTPSLVSSIGQLISQTGFDSKITTTFTFCYYALLKILHKYIIIFAL